MRAPWRGGDAAKRDAHVADRAAVEIERDSSRGQSEFVGLAVSYFEINRAARPRRGGNRKAGNDLTGQQRIFDIWRVARLQVQLGEGNFAHAVLAHDLDLRVERSQRLREVAGIGRNAVLTGAEYGVRPVDAVQRGAAGAGIALVAIGVGRVSKVGATRALQDVAAEQGHVADLRTGGELKRLGNYGVVGDHVRMVGGLRHRGEGAKPQVVRAGLDRGQRWIGGEGRNIDHVRGPHHIEASSDRSAWKPPDT